MAGYHGFVCWPAPNADSRMCVICSPKGRKILNRSSVIGSDGSPTTSLEMWHWPDGVSCKTIDPAKLAEFLMAKSVGIPTCQHVLVGGYPRWQ